MPAGDVVVVETGLVVVVVGFTVVVVTTGLVVVVVGTVGAIAVPLTPPGVLVRNGTGLALAHPICKISMPFNAVR